jgi:hypothetical protein
MTLRPHEDRARFAGIDHGPDFTIVVSHTCAVPRCGAIWFDKHHVWSRTHLGGAFNWVMDTKTEEIIQNVVGLCRSHHNDITAPLGGHKAQIEYSTSDKCFYWRKLKEIHDGTPDYAPLQVKALLGEAPGHPDATEPGSFPEQAAAPVRTATPATPPSLAEVIPVVASAAPHVHPGEKCPTCERKVPHPRKESSPTSKTRAYRLPVDENTSHEDVYAAAAEYVGAKGKPFEQFKTYTIALAALLQDESWRDFYNREADAA